MAHGKVASYPMETRMAVADALVNGRDYAEIREYLQSAGMTADNLPSDHSLKTFQEGVEYQSVYQDRRDACDLKLQAGRISGCATARVSLVQDRVLLVLERFLEKGLLETAEMLKLFALTLQYQKQELVTAKVRADMGTPVLPEALGPQEFSVAELESIMARLAVAKADTTDDETAATELPPDQAGGMAQDNGGSGRISEDNGGSARIPEDIAGSRSAEGGAGARLNVELVDAAIAELSARPAQDTAASASISEDIGGPGRIPEDIGGSVRISEEMRGFLDMPGGQADTEDDEDDLAVAMSVATEEVNGRRASSQRGKAVAARAFRASPSAQTRQKARAKRRKRRK